MVSRFQLGVQPKVKTLRFASILPRRFPVGAIFIRGLMEEIQNSILVFERLRQHIYQISIENGQVLLLRFSREHYHHLMGFQHLTDLESVSKPVSKQKFYGDVSRGKLRPEKMQKSVSFFVRKQHIFVVSSFFLFVFVSHSSCSKHNPYHIKHN